MPHYFNGGFKVDELGTLQTSAGPVTGYNQGIPVDGDGNVVVSEAAPSDTDQFVAGQRVLNSGAVCITSASPVINSPWSTGFSAGFGNGS